MKIDKIIYRIHAIKRMFERKIQAQTVIDAIKFWEVIENYPEDEPYPSCLILYFLGNKPIHVVVAINTELSEGIVITVYEPDSRWDKDFKKRV